MEAGRSVPRYHNMALLFPQSKKLQTNLTEYYIVVVKLCHKILQTSQSSSFMQLWDSFSDPLQDFQSQLKIWSTAIKDEVLIQSIAMTKEEKNDNSRFRAALQKERKEREIRRKQKARIQFLDRCSMYDHVTTWKQTRKIGNTKLFTTNQAYLDWKSSSTSTTLVYCGKLGAGKSVLIANIVSDLFLELKPQSYCIAYFFCDHENKGSLKARTILGSFTRQILQLHGSLEKLSEPSQDDTWHGESIPSITDFLEDGFSKTIYFVLDGLDECEAEHKDRVLEEIKSLQKKINLLFCISSRLEPDRISKFQSHELVSAKFSDIPEDNPDIADFVDHEIKACISSGKLRVMDHEIISTIKEVLLLGSQGMFLWVSLSIKALCGLPSDNDILEALANLPRKLSDTYIEILKKSADSHKTYLDLILQLLLVAIRPLSMEELRVALNVRPGETDWNASTLINDMLALLSSSGGLIVVDEEIHTVRFVHNSLRKFLTDSEIDSPYRFLLSNAERYMAQVLTTYLNYMCFDTRVSTVLVPKIDGAPIVNDILGSLGAVGRLFNKTSKGTDRDIGKILTEASIRSKRRQKTDLSLRDYARTFWSQHGASVMDVDSLTEDLVRKLMEKGYKFSLNDSYIRDPLAWTVENGYLKAFGYLLDSGLTFDGSEVPQRLCDATLRGDEEIVKKYLENTPAIAFMDHSNASAVSFMNHSKDIPIPYHECWNCKLFSSAIKGRLVSIVKLMLQQDQICSFVLNHGSAVVYQYARIGSLSGFGDFTVVKAIIDSQKLDLNEQCLRDEYNRTLLHVAVSAGQTDLVEVLLAQENIHLKVPSPFKQSLLSIASMKGYTRIVELLLPLGEPQFYLQDRPSQFSPLHWAAMYGHKDIVSLLLTARVHIKAVRNSANETPLILASKRGHIEVARMFLPIRYDQNNEIMVISDHYARNKTLIDRVDNVGRGALSYAAGNGNVQMIKLLIDSSNGLLDVRLRDSTGRSALSYAAEFGALEPVEILLSLQGGAWDEVDYDGKTPRMYCSHGGGDPATLSLLDRTCLYSSKASDSDN